MDPYLISFQTNGTVTVLAQAEDIDLPNVSTYGTGSVTYKRNGAAISQRTTFQEGDRLGVTVTGTSGEFLVSIPRYPTPTLPVAALFASGWYEPVPAEELRQEILNLYALVRGDVPVEPDLPPSSLDPDPGPETNAVLYGTDTVVYGTEVVVYG